MHFAIPDENPSVSDEMIEMRRGAVIIVVLFLLTIVTAVSFHNFMHLPPVFGMMTGLAYLQFYGFYLHKTHNRYEAKALNDEEKADRMMGDVVPFDIFNKVARAEWDTLLFFYGVVLSVGGLGLLGTWAWLQSLCMTSWALPLRI